MNPIRKLIFGGIVLLAFAGVAEAQTSTGDLRRVSWPLIDLVMAPDSACGVLLLAAPNPKTEQWRNQGSLLVDLRLDPVYALQWATVARGLLREDSAAARKKATRVAPALRSLRGGALLMLARREKGPERERFILLVSDTASKIEWKTFAGAAQVDTLLTALEQTGEKGWVLASARSAADSVLEERVDQPVVVVSQPMPEYPMRLAMGGRGGRVWMVYRVDSTGRPVPGSFHPLLSDDSLFTQSAIKALAGSRFRPAQRGGQPVQQRVFQVITFKQQ